MADNRLLIRCRFCGEEIPIARLSAGENTWEPSRIPSPEWGLFLAAHDHGDGVLDVELTSENDHGLAVKGPR